MQFLIDTLTKEPVVIARVQSHCDHCDCENCDSSLVSLPFPSSSSSFDSIPGRFTNVRSKDSRLPLCEAVESAVGSYADTHLIACNISGIFTSSTASSVDF